MEKEIINKAKEILTNADTSTNDCKIYNDGFMDGVDYAIKALRQLTVVESVCEVKKIKCHCYNDEMREECWANCDYAEQTVP